MRLKIAAIAATTLSLVGCTVPVSSTTTTATEEATAAAHYSTKASKPKATVKPKPKPVGFDDGTWLVGVDIKPGRYGSPGGEFCYWERDKDDKDSFSSIVANSGSSGHQRVTIRGSDYQFKSDGCGRWTKL